MKGKKKIKHSSHHMKLRNVLCITFSLETGGHSMEYAAQRNSCITLSNAAPP
jgi:hypothetical protein